MNSGRWVAIAIVGLTALFGVALWYTQTRAYYDPLTLTELSVAGADGQAITLALEDFSGIDADTSPLRFRACFRLVDAEVSTLIARAVPHPDATPLIAPAWFDCYDGAQIGADLENGTATALTGQVEIARGVDRVVAIYPDGRGFAWHQLNGTLE